jgi:hypothetical protein
VDKRRGGQYDRTAANDARWKPLLLKEPARLGSSPVIIIK